MPDRELAGTLQEISVVAKPDFSAWPPVRNFDLVVALADSDPRLRSGMSGAARIELDRLPDALLVPDQRDLPARHDDGRVRREQGRGRGAAGGRASPRTRPGRDRVRPARRRARGAARSRTSRERRNEAPPLRRSPAPRARRCRHRVARARHSRPRRRAPIPTARVQRGHVQVTVYTTGDLRAARSVQLTVPPMGGQLQIVKLAGAGDAVKSGDVVVALRSGGAGVQSRTGALRSAARGAGHPEGRAQAAVQAAEDEVALLHARYDVRRAELDTESNELLSDIKAKQNVLLLDEARQRLAQIEADVKTHAHDRRAPRRPACGRNATRRSSPSQIAERNIDSLTHPRAVRRLRHGADELPGVRRNHLLRRRRCPISASAIRRSPASRSPT